MCANKCEKRSFLGINFFSHNRSYWIGKKLITLWRLPNCKLTWVTKCVPKNITKNNKKQDLAKYKNFFMLTFLEHFVTKANNFFNHHKVLDFSTAELWNNSCGTSELSACNSTMSSSVLFSKYIYQQKLLKIARFYFTQIRCYCKSIYIYKSMSQCLNV